MGGRAVENERSAFALRAHTRREGRPASTLHKSEAVRSSRSVINTPFSLHFLKRVTLGLPPNAPHFLSALSAWLRGKSRFFFLSRVLYKSIIQGLPGLYHMSAFSSISLPTLAMRKPNDFARLENLVQFSSLKPCSTVVKSKHLSRLLLSLSKRNCL